MHFKDILLQNQMLKFFALCFQFQIWCSQPILLSHRKRKSDALLQIYISNFCNRCDKIMISILGMKKKSRFGLWQLYSPQVSFIHSQSLEKFTLYLQLQVWNVKSCPLRCLQFFSWCSHKKKSSQHFTKPGFYTTTPVIFQTENELTSTELWCTFFDVSLPQISKTQLISSEAREELTWTSRWLGVLYVKSHYNFSIMFERLCQPVRNSKFEIPNNEFENFE